MNKIKMSKQGLEKLATDVFGAEKDENLDLFYDIYEEEIIDTIASWLDGDFNK